MSNYFSIISILIALFVLARAHPTKREIKATEVKCAAGEILDENGKCVKKLVLDEESKKKEIIPKPQLSPEEEAKRKELKRIKKEKKRTIKKKLDEEIKDIKRLVFDGLEKGTIELKCPDGREINDQGECANEALPAVADLPVDEKKAKRAQRLEKRLQRELEKVLKKEIQNEIRKKKRQELKKQKKVKKPELGVNNGSSPKMVVDDPDPGLLPLCDGNGTADLKGCRPTM